VIDVFIGLGSNLAQPFEQLSAAFKSLAAIPCTQLKSHSSLYASRPMGPQDQPDFVNAVALISTELAPEVLLKQTQFIENRQGRVKKAQRWGPRTLDLDILLYGQQHVISGTLTIPHYGMKQREFVLYPLFEIAPDLVFPCGALLSEMVKACPINGLQKLNDSVHI
jgi:2-amino-4-hydroxy-6-hydroxymethyldihydropteridine diphosphokinase